jgi:hypothetical protein
MGLFVHPIYFTFHLTEVTMRYTDLKSVLMAVYEPRKQLTLTFCLFVLINYIFALLGYIFFSDAYAGNCDSMLYCLLTVLDNTFKVKKKKKNYLKKKKKYF